jgi:asparagine synthase (glutamine-hydrolysing)
LSVSAVESYLLFGSVSEPITMIEEVFSLPPGHSMTIDLGAASTPGKSEPYWNIAQAADRNGSARDGREAAKSRVRSLLEESVRLHLIADVPIGVFLSGGIDSTSLAALANQQTDGVHTFTVVFAEEEFSEAAIARKTANILGTRHQEIMLSGDEMLSNLDNAVGALDQPSIDGINTYFVSWAARNAGLKVALSGLGGDEIFGGYRNTFGWTPHFARAGQIGQRLPGILKSAIAGTISRTGSLVSREDASQKVAAVFEDSNALPDPYFFTRALFLPRRTAELMRVPGDTHQQQGSWREWLTQSASEARRLDDFTAVTCLEARSYLVNTLLRDTDTMSMAHSLEVRVPFLHHPLVEYVAQLPQDIKIGSRPKDLLVAALKDLIPDEVLNQKKRGFTLPWATWLRGSLKGRIEDGVIDLAPALRTLLNEKNTRSVWTDYLNGKTGWARPWSLYVLNEWVKRHVD